MSTRRRDRPAGVYVLIGLFLLAAPWSGGASDGPETAALAKAKLVLLAVTGVAAWARRPKRGTPLPGGFVCLLLYAGLTMIGAVFTPTSASADSIIRGLRYLITCLLVAWLAPRLTMASVQRACVVLAVSLGSEAVVAQVLGLHSASQGRLGGYLPPLHPNALAGILGIATLIAVEAWVRSEPHWVVPPGLVATGLALALVATGSRTSLAAIGIGFLALVAHGGLHDRRGMALTWIISAVALMLMVTLGPSGLWDAVTRNGQSAVDATFSGRSYAWSSVLSANHAADEVLFGQGLAVKRTKVDRQFVDEQTVDGSWHSAYLEGGVVGLGLVAMAAIGALARLRRHRRADRGIAIALLAFVLAQSVLESTLNDISFSFVLFLVLLLVPVPRRRARTARSGPTAYRVGQTG